MVEITRLFGLQYTFDHSTGDVSTLDTRPSVLTVEAIDRNQPRTTDEREQETAVFTWPDLGTFRVSGGREITTDLAEESDPTLVRNVLVGICFGALLYQRGYQVIHGSLVEADGETVAFVGHKGAGKSTSATALLARGHELLSDDIVAVRHEDDEPTVVPGFPMFKFDPEAFDDAALPAEPAPEPDTGTRRKYYKLNGEFDWRERPLSTVCLLDPNADGPRVTQLHGHEAVMALVEHAWPVRLRNAPYVDQQQSTIGYPDLDRYADLVEQCRVLRVSLDHDHETLDELGRDLESILSTSQSVFG